MSQPRTARQPRPRGTAQTDPSSPPSPAGVVTRSTCDATGRGRTHNHQGPPAWPSPPSPHPVHTPPPARSLRPQLQAAPGPSVQADARNHHPGHGRTAQAGRSTYVPVSYSALPEARPFRLTVPHAQPILARHGPLLLRLRSSVSTMWLTPSTSHALPHVGTRRGPRFPLESWP